MLGRPGDGLLPRRLLPHRGRRPRLPRRVRGHDRGVPVVLGRGRQRPRDAAAAVDVPRPAAGRPLASSRRAGRRRWRPGSLRRSSSRRRTRRRSSSSRSPTSRRTRRRLAARTSGLLDRRENLTSEVARRCSRSGSRRLIRHLARARSIALHHISCIPTSRAPPEVGRTRSRGEVEREYAAADECVVSGAPRALAPPARPPNQARESRSRCRMSFA